MKQIKWLFLGILLLLTAGCSSDSPDTKKTETVPLERNARTGIDRTRLNDPNMVLKPSGVRYLDLVIGDGKEVVDSMYIKLDYTVWTSDEGGLRMGRSFASSKGRPDVAYRGQVGVTGLVGLNDGLLGMKIGGSRRIYIPWELGYGDEGALPRTNLIFEIENIQEVPAAEVQEWQKKEQDRREYFRKMEEERQKQSQKSGDEPEQGEGND